MLIMRVVLALAMLSFCAIAFSEQPVQTPNNFGRKPQATTQKDEGKAEAYKGDAAGPPATMEIFRTPSTQLEITDRTEKRRDYSSSEWWLVYLTAALAVITLALATYTAMLWRATNRLVSGAEDTAKKQLRAYVCVKAATISSKPRSAPLVQVQITNFGQTPAYDVRVWIHIWIAEHPLATVLPIPEEGFRKADAVLAPGNHMIMVIRKQPPVPDNAVPLLGTRDGTIYVYGRIEYRDAFSEERWSNYRLIYGGSEPTEGDNMKHDSAGNDTSES